MSVLAPVSPSSILARAPLPAELVDAIAAVLDREAAEMSFRARAALLAGTRAAMDAWLEGSASTAQAVGALRDLTR
jgi:hypothetical protein